MGIHQYVVARHSIMKIALEKNCHEYPPITRESNGRWGFDVDQKAIKYKTKDFMNCAEEYDYVVDELLAQILYHSLLLEGMCFKIFNEV